MSASRGAPRVAALLAVAAALLLAAAPVRALPWGTDALQGLQWGRTLGMGNGLTGTGLGGGSTKGNFNAMARGAEGTVYIADTMAHCIRKKVVDATIFPNGTATTTVVVGQAGTAGFFDGTGVGGAASALLNRPTGVAVDSLGNLYIMGEWAEEVTDRAGACLAPLLHAR